MVQLNSGFELAVRAEKFLIGFFAMKCDLKTEFISFLEVKTIAAVADRRQTINREHFSFIERAALNLPVMRVVPVPKKFARRGEKMLAKSGTFDALNIRF